MRASSTGVSDGAIPAWRATLAGFAAILVGIGLARFTYTPLLTALTRAGWFAASPAAPSRATGRPRRGRLSEGAAVAAHARAGRSRPEWPRSTSAPISAKLTRLNRIPVPKAGA